MNEKAWWTWWKIQIAMMIIIILIIATSKIIDRPSNKDDVVLAGNPNLTQQQADTIILSTGEIIHRYDDADRNVTCYIVNATAKIVS